MDIECIFRLFLGVGIGLMLISPVSSFYPNRVGLLKLGGDDHTLDDITANGIMLAVAKYFETRPGDLTGLNPLTASNLYSAYYGERKVSPKNFEAAIQEIISENSKISNTKAAKAYWHMNGEQLKKGNNKILKMRGSLNGVLSETAPDYKIARLWIGRILHIMQMFYSNTDWLEMQIHQNYLTTKTIAPEVASTYADLGIEGTPFLAVAGPKERTCFNCEDGELDCVYNRHNAIKGTRYTSGYLSGQDVVKPEGSGTCNDVTFVSRSEWSARAPTSTSKITVPVPNVFIHHTDTPSCRPPPQDVRTCSSIVQSIQNYHMTEKGWDDIGYSFLIGEDGKVYEGRGWEREGAHTKGYNKNSIAISFIGTFKNIKPNEAALEAARSLINCGVGLGKISGTYIIRGHRDVGDTDCPGDELYAEFKTWPHYEGVGKCSHGGSFDDTRNTIDATGGINKQTSNPTLSPHYYYHSDAARLAVAATTDFFVHPDYGLLKTIGESHFRGIFNLGTGATLAMAIDDTGSMEEEISAVINECVQIVSDTANTVDAPYNYVVVTFNDPNYGPAFVTKDSEECITHLRSISVDGGNDCPEFSLSGIELALKNCLPNSDVLVFTDADAKDEHKATSVAALAKETRSRIRFILTGECSRRRRDTESLSPYDLVAEESGGAVYRGSKNEISEIVKLLDVNVGAALVYIAKKEITSSQFLLFPIDETINVFTITISGPSPRNAIIIYTPSGIELDLTGLNVTVNVDSSSVFSIDVGTPERGEWRCANNDSQTYDVEVTSQSIVDFQYSLMTVDATTGLASDIEGSPIHGAELVIYVKVFGVEYVSSVERVDLVSPVGEVIKQISLLMIETTTSDTYSASFIVPSEAFSIRLQATDTSGNSMRRLQPTTIRPEVFQLVLISSDTDELNPGSSIVTTFKVINTGATTMFNIVDSITGGDAYISSSITPSSVAASNSSDGNVTHVLSASSGTPIGTPVTVTVRVEEPSSGSFNYVVFSISVDAVSTVVIDGTAPTLSDASETGYCSNDKLGQDNCSDHTWSSTYQFTDDTEMGSITFYPPIDIEEMYTYSPGTIIAVLNGTCCCPLLSVTGVDLSGNSLTISANVTEQDAPEPVCIPPEPTGLPPGAYSPTENPGPGIDVTEEPEDVTEEPEEGLSNGFIALIVAVSVLAVSIIVVVFACVIMIKKRRSTEHV